MSDSGNGRATYRVSDVYEVPLRGVMLRLKVQGGEPSMKDLKRGAAIAVRSPDGARRTVHVKAIGVISGRAKQERLDRTREIDVLVSREDGLADPPVGIGWTVAAGENEGEDEGAGPGGGEGAGPGEDEGAGPGDDEGAAPGEGSGAAPGEDED